MPYSLKIKIMGYQGALSPIKQLSKTFIDLGHQIVDEDPDFIYNATGFFEDSIEYGKKYPKAVKMFNLLNADINNPNWGDGRNVRNQLLQADIPTTVSESTKKDIFNRIGIICDVIYFPMKDVEQKPIPKGIDFLYVGRLFNKEKRFWLAVETLKKLSRSIEKMVIVGPENPGVGYYAGLIGDVELSLIYNSSQYLFCPCIHEGSMSMIEAVMGDCFPLVCNDNNWVYEFGLDCFVCEPNADSFIAKIKDIENNIDKYVKIIDKLKPKIIEKFEITNVVKRIINLYHEYKNERKT